MNIRNNISFFQNQLTGKGCRLVAVSKTHPIEKVQEAYDAGQRIFGENKVQEMVTKHEQLPADIEWHMIGHLQRNKVKQIVPFVSLIHGVDSLRLLEEIHREAKKTGRTVPCLLQVYIASEETKFGLDEAEVLQLIQSEQVRTFDGISIRGLMGMATFTSDTEQVRREFRSLKTLFEKIKTLDLPPNISMHELSMGMSQDYLLALEEGSTLVRIGTAIFGSR